MSETASKASEESNEAEKRTDKVSESELKCNVEGLLMNSEKGTESLVSPNTRGNSDVASDNSPTNSSVDLESESVNEVTNNWSMESKSYCSTMPDITVQVPRKDKVNERMDKVSECSNISEETEGNTSSIISVTGESDSELDSSLESVQSEDSVRPGHVKHLIAKVDSIGKVSDLTASGAKSPTGGDKTISDVAFDDALDFIGMSSTQEDLSAVCLEVNGVESDRPVSVENDVKPESALKDDEDNYKFEIIADINQASAEGEVYVTKSLPELAQVFEPRELKQKKRKGKNNKGKSTEDKI